MQNSQQSRSLVSYQSFAYTAFQRGMEGEAKHTRAGKRNLYSHSGIPVRQPPTETVTRWNMFQKKAVELACQSGQIMEGVLAEVGTEDLLTLP